MARGTLSARLRKWRRWLASARTDIESLVRQRGTHADLLVLPGAKEPSLTRYLEDQRVNALSLGLRRQLRLDSKSINLAGLIRDLESVLAGGPGDAPPSCRTAESHGSCVSTTDAIVGLAAELRRIESAAVPVQRYADRRLAHADKRPGSAVPPLVQLEALLDELAGLGERVAWVIDAVERDTAARSV